MSMAYRLFMYIIMANVAFMIFSLVKKGFRRHLGYILELLFLLILIVGLVFRDISAGISIAVSLGGILLLVIFPIYLQRKIDALMAENRLYEIEPYARWKANIAQTDINTHLHTLAVLAEKYEDDTFALETGIRELIGRGMPFDETTRAFLGLIHFNNRNFSRLIDDLRVSHKDMSDQSFEELLYLTRAYLETARYDEAVEAQFALERKIQLEDENQLDKKANILISRMIFFAFLGWTREFIVLIKANKAGIERLPQHLKSFWQGVCVFNSGEYQEGERQMTSVMNDLTNAEYNENWLPFMKKRFSELIDNRDFFDRRILAHLKTLYRKHVDDFTGIIEKENISSLSESLKKAVVSRGLVLFITFISAFLMSLCNIEDVVELVAIGANSSFLVKSGEYFRLFTYNLIHIGWIHMFMNVMALNYFAPSIELVFGWPLLLGIFFFSGITGGIATVYAGQPLSAGASAAVLGLLSSAIIVELFKVRGSERLIRNNNFATLIFILVINLIIGTVEKGIDNSAHIGGLLGGALITIFLIPILRYQRLKRIAGVLSLVFLFVIATLSLWQMVEVYFTGFYPKRIDSFSRVSNASNTVSLDIPAGWKLNLEEQYTLSISGPLREQATFIVASNHESVETLLNSYVEQGTKEIEGSNDINLKSRKGPEKLDITAEETWRIRWLLSSDNGPISVVDYLVFKDNIVILSKFFLGTERDYDYDFIMNHIISSITLK